MMNLAHGKWQQNAGIKALVVGIIQQRSNTGKKSFSRQQVQVIEKLA